MSQDAQASRIAVLLFTDMVDSVALERRLGTEAYSRLLMRHNQLFREALARVGGGKIQLDTGDGFLCEFSTAADAVNAALLFQMFLRDNKWETEVPKVRIGAHQGQLAELRTDPTSPGKIVGIPVSIANRVMSLAHPGQILMTRPVYDDARQFIRQHPCTSKQQPPALKWKVHGPYVFKGADEPIEIFEVGAAGFAPLAQPPDSEKARRATFPAAGLSRRRIFLHRRRPAVGAALAVLCGMALWALPLGEPWVNASYDYLFRFGARMPTNKVALILMDNQACEALGQTRRTWDRALHAQMLSKLADAGAGGVVFDILFRTERSAESDNALAAAMRRHGKVILMTKLSDPRHPLFEMANVAPPAKLFLEASAGTGIGHVGVENLETVRRHWPPVADPRYQSLPWVAARLAGARLHATAGEQWLRYYGQDGAWETFSYHLALSNAPAHFKNRIVFIGDEPANNKNPMLAEEDKFCTPYTRWTGESVGGVEILATTFLNLMNGDWLRRPPWVVEGLLVILAGGMLGGGLCRLSRARALAVGLGLALAVSLAGVSLSYFTNYWFPWLIIVGGQVPCALGWALAPARKLLPAPVSGSAVALPEKTVVVSVPRQMLPDAPEYELFDPPFGEGGFGKVWLARNAVGQWQALKAVYQAKFGNDLGPYEAEFNGLQKYKPISEKHPGLLRIDLVSRKKGEGYFYYVMELGDALLPGWEKEPARYRPKDLEAVRREAYGHRLPVAECLRIGFILADALDFLHRQGLTHRDIKPSNIIFVEGRPKLADVGLITDLRPLELVKTMVGTAGYIPPSPERAGTAQADIYSLGMVLYVISTGRNPDYFPDLSTTLVEQNGHAEFMRLNAIIIKACQPDRAERYHAASEMLQALRAAQA
jgi:CHASE2 domain-containing sensor protein/class 3 adenylate cyclase